MNNPVIHNVEGNTGELKYFTENYMMNKTFTLQYASPP